VTVNKLVNNFNEQTIYTFQAVIMYLLSIQLFVIGILMILIRNEPGQNIPVQIIASIINLIAVPGGMYCAFGGLNFWQFVLEARSKEFENRLNEKKQPVKSGKKIKVDRLSPRVTYVV
jgi:hypothetical protein